MVPDGSFAAAAASAAPAREGSETTLVDARAIVAGEPVRAYRQPDGDEATS